MFPRYGRGVEIPPFLTGCSNRWDLCKQYGAMLDWTEELDSMTDVAYQRFRAVYHPFDEYLYRCKVYAYASVAYHPGFPQAGSLEERDTFVRVHARVCFLDVAAQEGWSDRVAYVSARPRFAYDVDTGECADMYIYDPALVCPGTAFASLLLWAEPWLLLP